jgi:integrase/recombinase XerD
MTELEPVFRSSGLARIDAAALERLPGTSESDPFTRLAAAFLLHYPTRTRTAYASDLRLWAQWCADRGLHPLHVQPHHLDGWADHHRTTPTRTGRPAAPATLARRLSTLAAFYNHGVRLGVLDHSPTAGIRRPQVATESTTLGLTLPQLQALLRAADAHSPRSSAAVGLLILSGLRVSEALGADVRDLATDTGHRVLLITRKGGKAGKVAMPPPALQRLDTYLNGRTTGPLLLAADGRGRYTPQMFARQLRRLAHTAGIDSADRIHPHSLRHSFATRAFDLGLPLQDVQDALGHADPRTTRRYDRSRNHLARSPGYLIARDF